MGNNDNEPTTLSQVRVRAGAWWHKLRLSLAATPSPDTPDAPEPEQELPTRAPGSALYQHTAPAHQPRNINRVHRREQETAGFNTRVAVWLTKNVGTMQCAYVFACIGIGSLVGVATNNVVLAAIFGSLSSYFLQLVLLPILSVGQNVLGRHAELQADEMFKTSQRSFHDIEEIMSHLSAQDEELLRHTRLLLQLTGQSAADAASAAPVTPALPAPPAAPATRTAATSRSRRGKQPS